MLKDNFFYLCTKKNKLMEKKIRIKSLLLLLVAVIFFSSCSTLSVDKLPKISSQKIENFKFISATNINITIAVSLENQKNKSYQIKDLEGKVYRKGKLFANIVLVEPIKIEPLYLGIVRASFNIKLLDANSALMMGLSGFNNLNLDDFTADILTTAKVGCLKKKINLKNYPVKVIISYLE